MNVARIATLLRELADELERDGARALPNNNAPKSQRRKQVRKPFVAPRPISELEKARARQHLRKLGIPIP